ncbi:MAG: HAMP domain-containing histidine kinase [Lachnospiraceae bacterium]|nr:HAMP domain-containing histidine kinase [Lachnospiraceae bacterium]
MNPQNIEKIRRKFILVASLSFFSVMLLMGGFIYAASFLATQSDIRSTLDYIVENDGEIKRKKVTSDVVTSDEITESYAEDDENTGSKGLPTQEPISIKDSLNRIFGVGNWMHSSAEFPYSIRYFAVLYGENGEVEAVKTSHIAAVEKEDAETYAEYALSKGHSFGSLDNYYFKVAERTGGGKIVVYLEALSQMNATSRIFYFALMLIAFGSIVTLLLVLFFSKRIVQGEIKRNEMQDRFMTNASHELKTPLAVIKANTEVEQMLNGENEWNRSTMQQVERMTGLIANLIRIVRAEEKENAEPLSHIDVSAIVQETADTFQPVASQEEKELSCDIEPSVNCLMRETDVRQLMSLFIDNAIKYCDEKGKIVVSVKTKGRTLKLSVSNDFAEGKDTDYSKFFERFYRQDESHNIEKGGYGIGLSIAESIAEQYKGTIKADWKDGVITFSTTFHSFKQKSGKGHTV